jgi:hypothetical protein
MSRRDIAALMSHRDVSDRDDDCVAVNPSLHNCALAFARPASYRFRVTVRIIAGR